MSKMNLSTKSGEELEFFIVVEDDKLSSCAKVSDKILMQDGQIVHYVHLPDTCRKFLFIHFKMVHCSMAIL